MAENFKTDFFTDRMGVEYRTYFKPNWISLPNGFTRKAVSVGKYREPGDHTRAIRCINGRTTEPELFGHSGRRRSNRTF